MPKIEMISFDGENLMEQIRRSTFTATQLSMLIGNGKNYLSNACGRGVIPAECAKKLEAAGFEILVIDKPTEGAVLPDNFDERVEAALYKAMKKLKAEEEGPEEPAVPVDDYSEEQPDPFAVAIHWVPCYASLPRTNEIVLITRDFFSKADKEYVRKVFAARYEKGKWMVGQKELFSTVHAWAKMPEPYME